MTSRLMQRAVPASDGSSASLAKKMLTREQRSNAKTVNFGIIYGITQYGLAKQISVSNEEALSFINSYFKKFPEIKDYMNTTIKICRKQGFVTNIFGRRIHLRGINDKNFSVRAFQERAAINAPIQGSAADQTKQAMIDLHAEGITPMIQIHDEIAMSVKTVAEAKNIAKIMENALPLSVPNLCDVEIGPSWGSAR